MHPSLTPLVQRNYMLWVPNTPVLNPQEDPMQAAPQAAIQAVNPGTHVSNPGSIAYPRRQVLDPDLMMGIILQALAINGTAANS